MELFVDQGFEKTTVDQIAAVVGMSTRSVFLYFATREDMVAGNLMGLGHDVAEALEDRPANEPPWTALRHALQVCVDSLEGAEAGLRTATMSAGTPALRTAMLSKHAQWERLLVPQVPTGSTAPRRPASCGRTPWSPARCPASTSRRPNGHEPPDPSHSAPCSTRPSAPFRTDPRRPPAS